MFAGSVKKDTNPKSCVYCISILFVSKVNTPNKPERHMVEYSQKFTATEYYTNSFNKNNT